MSHGQNVTVDVMIGSKCHCGRSELGRNVQAAAGGLRLGLPSSASRGRRGGEVVFVTLNIVALDNSLPCLNL